jgi:hypothetical protein
MRFWWLSIILIQVFAANNIALAKNWKTCAQTRQELALGPDLNWKEIIRFHSREVLLGGFIKTPRIQGIVCAGIKRGQLAYISYRDNQKNNKTVSAKTFAAQPFSFINHLSFPRMIRGMLRKGQVLTGLLASAKFGHYLVRLDYTSNIMHKREQAKTHRFFLESNINDEGVLVSSFQGQAVDELELILANSGGVKYSLEEIKFYHSGKEVDSLKN